MGPVSTSICVFGLRHKGIGCQGDYQPLIKAIAGKNLQYGSCVQKSPTEVVLRQGGKDCFLRGRAAFFSMGRGRATIPVGCLGGVLDVLEEN